MADGRWLGVHLKSDGEVTTADAFALVRLAEELGYSGVTFNEDIGHDVFALLGALATMTSTIALGSAIANVYCRSAMQLAMGAATVDEISGGRMMLGVSVGHHPWNDLYHGIPIDAPLARLRECVELIRAVRAGDRVAHDGRFFPGVETRLGFPPYRPDLPVYVGGDRAKILALSAEVADGSIMNFVPARYVADFAAEHYYSTARRAGRRTDDLELTAIVTCCVNDDPAAARRAARSAFISRLASNPNKVIELRPHGAEELREMSALIRCGERHRAEAEISEELVLDTVAAGGASDVRAVIDRFYSAGCSRVLVAAYPRRPDSIRKMVRAVAPATVAG